MIPTIVRMLSIAATEARVAIRNRWVVTAIALMTVFSLALAFAGSAPAGTLAVDRLTATAASLSTLAVYLVPLLALLMSYDSVAGEADRGTLPLLLTYPVSRSEILIGKFAAQTLVLVAAIGIGFGATALVVGLAGEATAAGIAHIWRLVWTSALLGCVFLAIGNALSVSCRQPGTAAAMAVAIWILAVVLLDVVLLAALVADDGGLFSRTIFPWLMLASPTDAFRLYNTAALEAGAVTGGLASATQSYQLPVGLALVSLVAWSLALILAAAGIMRRLQA